MQVYIDIGTSKVAAMAMQVGQRKVLGVAKESCDGLSQAMVADMDKTQASIQRVVKNLQEQLKTKIDSAIISITGEHIQTLSSSGVVGVQNKEVQQTDIDRVLEAARAVSLATSQEILHVLPLEYVVDGQRGVQRPLGMSGVRLEVHVLLVTCLTSAFQNTLKCVELCGVEVEQVVVSHLASGASVLTPDERDLGVCVVDIGAGTADVSLYCKGVLHGLFVVPIAGSHVTGDLSIALRTPHGNAERVKLEYGVITDDPALLDEVLEVAGVVPQSQARVVKRRVLVEVVQARYYEIFNCILRVLRKKELLDRMPAGFVLTGGASKTPGVAMLLEAMSQMPVRVAAPVLFPEEEGLEGASMATLQGLAEVSTTGVLPLGKKADGFWSRLTKMAEHYF